MRQVLSDRVIFDILKVLVLLSVIVSITLLGIKGEIDAAAITGVLGTVVGAVGAQGSAAIAEHIRDKARADGRASVNGGTTDE